MMWRRVVPAGSALDQRLQWEAGPALAPDWTPRRVAVVAHWSQTGSLSRSVRELCRQFVGMDFETVVVSSAEFSGDRPGSQVLPAGVSLWRRPNSGYDFGTWSVALQHFPGIRDADEVLLVNDSMVGPFDTLAPIVERMSGSGGLVWGLTESFQKHWHLQSNFVGYRSGILGDPALAQFWTGIAHHGHKDDVITNYEIGLGRLLEQLKVPVAAAFPTRTLPIRRRQNPTIRGWSALLAAGLPMVKRQLITDPAVAPDADRVRGHVKQRYGQDVADWL